MHVNDETLGALEHGRRDAWDRIGVTGPNLPELAKPECKVFAAKTRSRDSVGEQSGAIGIALQRLAPAYPRLLPVAGHGA